MGSGIRGEDYKDKIREGLRKTMEREAQKAKKEKI